MAARLVVVRKNLAALGVGAKKLHFCCGTPAPLGAIHARANPSDPWNDGTNSALLRQ